MGGKASLLVVTGFSLMFLVIANNFGTVSNRSIDNYVNYFDKTTAHNIAISGANMAANEIYLDPTWVDGFSDEPYQDGTLDVSINILNSFQNIREIVSKGKFDGITSTVRVTLAPSKFSKFAYYSVSEGKNIWWTENDTVWGPFHTQDEMRVYNHPVFYGKATTQKKLIYYHNEKEDKPYFYGGFEQGVNLPMPSDAVSGIESPAKSDGLYFPPGQDTVYLTFDYDSLKYKYRYNQKYKTVYLPDAVPNGVIFAHGTVVRLQGVVQGQYSVVASTAITGEGRGGEIGGTIYLDDDVVYSKDPRMDPTSTDLLGIIAEDGVLITDNAANHDDINIDASIFCQNGGFGADNYEHRPVSGNINLLGGIIQNTRQAVGTFDKRGPRSGFSKRYKYDNRFLVASPPYFPGTGSFEIVAWYE